jgi:hypothetical protein
LVLVGLRKLGLGLTVTAESNSIPRATNRQGMKLMYRRTNVTAFARLCMSFVLAVDQNAKNY